MSNFKFFHGKIDDFLVGWEPEFDNGIDFYNNLQVEEELNNYLSNEIARTIDDEIVGRLFREATGGMIS
jgi:hypothetical protein